MGPFAGYLLETFVTLAVVCVVAIAVLYGARRLGLGRPQGPIRLVGHLPLDARRAIYLVRVGEQVLVVGVGEGGMSKLGEVAAAELHSDPPPPRTPFGDVLARVLSRPKPGEEQRPS